MTTDDRKNMHTLQFDKTEEFTAEEARALLEASGERTKSDIDAYVKRAKALEGEPDAKILEMVRAADKVRSAQSEAAKKKASRGGRRLRRLSRYAAVFLISCISVGAVGAVASDAFRAKLFNIFVSEETGSVVLESIPEDSPMESWSDYWYPEYLPEGFKFTAAEETNFEKIIRFDSIDLDAVIVVSISADDSTVVALDSTQSGTEHIDINSCDGYISVDEENETCSIVWITDNHIIDISSNGYVNKAEMIKMANEMQYIE